MLSAAVTSVLAVYVWERRTTPGAATFSGIMLVVTFWAAANLIEIFVPAASTKIFWHNAKILPAAFVPLGWLAFSALYTGRRHWVHLRRLALIGLIPLTTVVLTWFFPALGWVYREPSLVASPQLAYIVKGYGPWFWVHILYSDALILLSVLTLVLSLNHTSRWYARQVLVLVTGVLLPWVGYGINIIEPEFLPGLDLPPIGFAISGILLTWGFFSFRLFDVKPIARSAVFEHTRDGAFVFDEKDRLVDLNACAAQLIGLQLPQAIGQPVQVVFSKFPQVVDLFLSRSDGHKEIVTGEGESQRCMDVRLTAVNDSHQHLTGSLIELRETTDSKRTQLEMQKSHELLTATLEALADGILVISGRGKTLWYNRKFADMWKIPAALTSSGNDQEWLAFVVDQLVNPAAFYRLMNRLVTQPDADSYDVLELKDGRIFERYSRPQRIAERRIGRVWSFRDITEQRRAEEKLRYLSTHDILTGLYNRVYFEEELNRLENSRQFPICIIVADVDGLKETNDQLGHQAGDALLRKAADVLRQACRAEDLVARIGGDEFGIVLPFSDASVAENAIQRIHNILAVARVGEGEIPISLSLGSATGANGDSLRKVFRLADEAMYRVKVGRKRKRGAAGLVENTGEPAVNKP